jgi:hypothetical protein
MIQAVEHLIWSRTLSHINCFPEKRVVITFEVGMALSVIRGTASCDGACMETSCYL